MKYQIITDSCCDFTIQQYQDLNVAYVPLTVTYNGESHDNFTDPADVKAFYDQLRQGVTASTAAANPDGWANAMKPFLDAGEDILCLTFSSGLSTTCQSAYIAAKELREYYPDRKITVIDTLCAALGQGLLVWYACQKRDAGLSLDETADWVEDNKLKLCHEVTVADLDTLKRGGRISATTAFVGIMLNIKPMIHVDNEGHLINYSKVRGRKASIEHIVKRYLEKASGCVNETIFIGHGDCPEDAATLEKQLRAADPGIKNVVTGYVGPVIGAHTGPGVLVAFFMGNQR